MDRGGYTPVQRVDTHLWTHRTCIGGGHTPVQGVDIPVQWVDTTCGHTLYRGGWVHLFFSIILFYTCMYNFFYFRQIFVFMFDFCRDNLPRLKFFQQHKLANY